MNEIEIDASTWRRCGGGRLNSTGFTTTTGARGQLRSLLLLGLLAHSVYSNFDKSSLKSYPGPLFARLSDLWLTWITARGRVNRVVAEAHKVYGTPCGFTLRLITY